MRTKQDVLKRLWEDGITLPPLSFQLIEWQPEGKPGLRLDAIVRAHWQNRSYDFGLEYKSLSTPKAFQEAIHQTLEGSKLTSTYPMVMMPYLSDAQLRELEARQISGLDLCGNGIVTVPGELLVFRTGAPNQFPNSAPIKNVYRRASSLVARGFLLKPEFATVNEIQVFVNQHRHISYGNISISTVSKVVKSLEEDLIVGRESGKIRLLQPEKLLDKLVANYQPPEIKARYPGKFLDSQLNILEELYGNALAEHLPLVATGAGSIHRYGVMERDGPLSFYCPKIYQVLFSTKPVPIERAFRFPDIEIVETDDETVYFDIREGYSAAPKKGFMGLTRVANFWPLYPVASPIQTYLELMVGDARDKQTAEQVKEIIFREMEAQTT